MQKAISKYWPVFVLPTLLAFIIGFIWPFIWGIYLSFQRFTTVSKTTFVGLQNYINVFSDETFLHAFSFTAACRICSTLTNPTLTKVRTGIPPISMARLAREVILPV